jgi:hypothetical protein
MRATDESDSALEILQSKIRGLEAELASCRSEDHWNGNTGQLDEGMRARGIPEGTKAMATALLCFAQPQPYLDVYQSFLHFNIDDDLCLSYFFEIETAEHKGKFILQDLPVKGDPDGGEPVSESKEMYEMISSATNLFASDESPAAEEIRAEARSAGCEWLDAIDECNVAVEIGKSADGLGRNVIARFLTPGDPDYLEVMQFKKHLKAGTGPDGKHIPPAGLTITVS